MFYHIDKCDIVRYADNNTSYTSDVNLKEVIQKLELTTNNLFEWFEFEWSTYSKQSHETQR